MKRISILLLIAAITAGCTGHTTLPAPEQAAEPEPSPTLPAGDEWDQALAKREYDYSAALRTAALRLTGDLPTMDELNQVANAPTLAAKKVAYQGLVQNFMARPAFARQMFSFWRDTFKMGGTAEMDTAPALAAWISMENRSYMSLLVQKTGNCPTFDEDTAVFTPAECKNGAAQAGVLTNPGVMKQFFSNFAFRRVGWIEETFDCTKFPIELNGTATDVGAAAPYTGLWAFTSIADLKSGGRVDFRDVSSVICAHCHQTINHIAPLFAHFDGNGVYQQQLAVPTPLEGAPKALFSDYLPAGEKTAWRFGQPVDDIPSLGAAMAADPGIARCGVARIWNWALGKTDIVDTLQDVPLETIKTQIDAFTASGFKMKDLIYAVYTSDDFTKF